MNQHIVDLFADPGKRQKLITGLPIAFEKAGIEMPNNPAVGFLREHAITGFFVCEFGRDNVVIPDGGVKKGYDIVVCGKELSIKTVTRNGGVKMVWTVDNNSVDDEIHTKYTPSCDMLLTRIWWDEDKESVFYIPLEVQKYVFLSIGRFKYLSSSRNTNNRGIEASSKAIKLLSGHKETISLRVNWVKQGFEYTPYSRWETFWKEM